MQDKEVQLVDARFLVKWFKDGKGPIKRRQDMPEEAFLPESCLTNDDIQVIAISYCWCTSKHPDPKCFHLEKAVRLLEVFLEGRYNEQGLESEAGSEEYDHSLHSLHRAGYVFGPATSSTPVGVFWDFMSLPQEPRSEQEEALFKGALNFIAAWYGHQRVTTWILPELPGEHPTHL